MKHTAPFFRPRAGTCQILVAALTIGLCLGSITAEADPRRPNIVLILGDDLAWGDEESMPNLMELVAARGITFTNAINTATICCPSRASILRGQYVENHQTYWNSPPNGGVPKFFGDRRHESTFATWLDDAGYFTGIVGKVLNHHIQPEYGVPPGWDYATLSDNAHEGYDYSLLLTDGTMVPYGSVPEDFLNDVLTQKAVEFLEQAKLQDEPFMLYVAPSPPHSPHVAAPRHVGLNKDAKLPRSPSYNEPDRSDKPWLLRNLPPLTDGEVQWLETQYRRRLDTLATLDEMVKTLVETLERTKQLDKTYVFFASDNGFHIAGEHGMLAGKNTAYWEDLLAPVYVRGPGIPEGVVSHALVANIDLAPTFAAIAKAKLPDFVDGRSILPLLLNPGAPWSRQTVRLERYFQEDQTLRQARAAGIPDEDVERAARYDGLFTGVLTYVEYPGTGEAELYDVRADPHQLANVIPGADPEQIEDPRLADFVSALSTRVAELRDCAGDGCRRLEDLPAPEPQPQVTANRRTPAEATEGVTLVSD
jgi:arylsulfatase A-like enzyme